MANHKRRRPKNRRAGCQMCKPHKSNGCKRSKTFENRRARVERILKREFKEG